MQQGYEQERAQRVQEFQNRVAEIHASADAQLKELAAQHAAEIKQLHEQKAQKIRELDAQYAEERKRRYQQFIQNIRDLDAGLLGEKKLREQYQAAMLKDLDSFLLAYKTGLSSLQTAVPHKQEGGYTAGLVRTGEKGYEYILSHNTARAAENIIGGRLTQDSLLAALMNSGGNKNVVWQDQRRFSGEYSNAMRREVRNDTQRYLVEALT